MSKNKNSNIMKKIMRSRRQSGVYKNVDVTLTRKERQHITLIAVGAFIPLFIGLVLIIVN